MSVSPAYSAYPERAVARSSQRAVRHTQRGIGVVPGGRTAASPEPRQSGAMLAVKVLVALLIVVACVGVARVALTTATVSASIQTQELSGKIDKARSDGVELEAAQSVLATSSRVKGQASDLGMAAPASVESLSLAEDVVVLNEDGTLSLSKSLAATARSGA